MGVELGSMTSGIHFCWRPSLLAERQQIYPTALETTNMPTCQPRSSEVFVVSCRLMGESLQDFQGVREFFHEITKKAEVHMALRDAVNVSGRLRGDGSLVGTFGTRPTSPL